MKKHIPVMVDEVLKHLDVRAGQTIVDATLGAGGHSVALLEKIFPEGRLIVIDRDKLAVDSFQEYVQKRFKGALRNKSIICIHGNFSNLEQLLAERGIEQVDAVIADLGISSDQLEDPQRGLSFQVKGPLDMRLDMDEGTKTAVELLNSLDEKSLAKILWENAQEQFASRIARAIVEQRENVPIETTQELSKIVLEAIPKNAHGRKIHPATKSFMALRIVVNKEFDNLDTFIRQAIKSVRIGGKIGIITFHSGEDRRVKRIFQENARGCICPANFPECVCGRQPIIKILTKKAIIPSEKERIENPRARSAKLRVVEKIHAHQIKEK